MTLLKSINLSNTRRFADNVSIEFGPGATILLAPNGTGKTTIFEAIELALTGTISRLNEINNNLTPFVRDGKAQSTVRLDFGEGLIRTANLVRGKAPEISGNLGNLLGTTGKNDIPYLLRLTHLLDQHDRRWFVEAKSDDAGSRLAALPVGKDGVKAIGVITSAKKALNEKRKEVERRLNEISEKQTKWQKLLFARDNSTIDFGRPLIPLAEVPKVLKPLAVSVGTQVQEKATLSALKDSISEIGSLIDQQYDLLQVRSGNLTKCDNVLAEYPKARQTLDQARLQLAQLQRIKSEREEGLSKAQANLDEQDLALLSYQNSRRQFIELQQRFEALANAKVQETTKEEILKQAEKTVAAAKQALATATDDHHLAHQSHKLHGQLRSRNESLKRSENELDSAREMLARWLSLFCEISNLDSAIKGMESEVEKLSSILEGKVASANHIYDAAKEAQFTFDGISQASGAIREAVSIIALRLPKDRNDCPLCGQEHGAQELQRRMSEALQAIDPALGPAADRVEKSRRDVEEADKALKITRKAIAELQAEVIKAEWRRAEILSDITEIKSQQIFVSYDVESAPAAINAKSVEIETLRRILVADVSAAPVEPTSETLTELENKLRSAETDLEFTQNRLGEANTALCLALDHRRAAEEAMGEAKETKDLAPQLVAIETTVTQATNTVEEARTERDRRRIARDEANTDVRSWEDVVSSATERIQGLQTHWSSTPLDGEPTAEALTAAKQQMSESLSKIDESRKELQTIRTEVARWEAAEIFHRAQNEVAEFRGDSSEEAFTTSLVTRINEAEAEVNRVDEGVETLETFHGLLKKECNEANQRVSSVVPLWKTLLNRVVREPRFAETSLDVFSHYNKPHAKTTVTLHGKQTEVHAVASEAQMTDLQLTFLLAMAQQNAWSPWRALLLDDPTQHHDLVHASAVFDLLRDYIADYGFQVVIATHDSLQARFFMRKLENDGIESRMWRLSPADDGVRAYRER